MIVYCRSCNRDVTVLKELEDTYVERFEGEVKYHAKRDCDIVSYFGKRPDNKPEISRKDIHE